MYQNRVKLNILTQQISSFTGIMREEAKWKSVYSNAMINYLIDKTPEFACNIFYKILTRNKT